ncbi:MAG: polysaccharide deacetylase family protein [Treponema sp.]|jgi:peptidoglycan/xylan/chitin deacetylase (PgdA/CDA1 family)|nr:polysaccharide deacetylase family protein [Treponema sp.]
MNSCISAKNLCTYLTDKASRFKCPSVLWFVRIFAACTVYAACAHPPRPLNVESMPVAAVTATSVESVQESETAVMKEKPGPPEKTLMQQALETAQQDKTKKYFVAEKDNITVKADIDVENRRFTAIYDVAHAEVDLRHAILHVSFSIEDEETHETRTGVLKAEGAPDAGILLAFDDDYHENWERNFGLFDRFGARVTFFVQGKPLGFCKLALEWGHDVGYHTMHHLNLPRVPKTKFLEECTAEIGVFRDAGIPLNSFAYPFGLYEPWMSDILLTHFNILRGYGVTFHIYDRDTIRGFIASKAIDNTLYKNDSEFKALTLLMLRTVKLTGGVLPLTTHDISTQADWGIKPERLEFLLKTAADLKLKFYVYKDFLD